MICWLIRVAMGIDSNDPLFFSGEAQCVVPVLWNLCAVVAPCDKEFLLYGICVLP